MPPSGNGSFNLLTFLGGMIKTRKLRKIIVYIIVSYISFKLLKKLQKRHYDVLQQALASNKKCLKQQSKIDTLQSELNQLKDRNGGLSSKLKIETETFSSAKDKMQQELSEYKIKNNELKQQNKDQWNKINDMKSENDAIKSDVNVFQQRNKNLIHRIDELKNKENQLLLEIHKLKQKLVTPQSPVKTRDSDVAKDMKNPWFAVLQMT